MKDTEGLGFYDTHSSYYKQLFYLSQQDVEYVLKYSLCVMIIDIIEALMCISDQNANRSVDYVCVTINHYTYFLAKIDKLPNIRLLDNETLCLIEGLKANFSALDCSYRKYRDENPERRLDKPCDSTNVQYQLGPELVRFYQICAFVRRMKFMIDQGFYVDRNTISYFDCQLESLRKTQEADDVDPQITVNDFIMVRSEIVEIKKRNSIINMVMLHGIWATIKQLFSSSHLFGDQRSTELRCVSSLTDYEAIESARHTEDICIREVEKKLRAISREVAEQTQQEAIQQEQEATQQVSFDEPSCELSDELSDIELL
jgi:hypothetical protein